MTKFNFLIAPDFAPEYFTGWHFLSTRLQRLSELPIHLILPPDANEEKQYIDSNDVDLIYANPFDTTKLVREMGYLPLAYPKNHSDETVIATSADHASVKKLEDLKPGMTALYTDNLDTKLVGLRLLEAVDIGENDLNWVHADSFPAMARALIQNEADIGFFMESAYHSMTDFTRKQLGVLIESKIRDLSHVLLLHPRQAELHSKLQEIFTSIQTLPSGQTLLDDLGLSDGFAPLTQQEVEYIIDLIETLRD